MFCEGLLPEATEARQEVDPQRGGAACSFIYVCKSRNRERESKRGRAREREREIYIHISNHGN